MRSHRPSADRVWSLLTIAGPALVVFILGSLACTFEGTEDFDAYNDAAPQPGAPDVRVMEGEPIASGRLVYGDTIEVTVEHEPCDGELILEANGVQVERWSRTYYGETRAQAVLDVSDALSTDAPVSEVLFGARLSCYDAAEAQGLSEPVYVVATVAQVPSETRNLIMGASGLYSWDIDRFSSVTTREGKVERVESARTTLRHVVRAVQEDAQGRLFVEDTRGDLNVFTTEPLELAWSASTAEQKAIGVHVHASDDVTRVWAVREDDAGALTIAELGVADGAPVWELALERDVRLLAGPILSADGDSVRVALVAELEDGNHELLEAVVPLGAGEQAAQWESLRISSRSPSADVVGYTDDGAHLMVDVADNAEGVVLLALARGDGASWQLPVDSDLVGGGRFDDDTFWVATTLSLYLVDGAGESKRQEALGAVIERVLPDPSGARGAVVVTSSLSSDEVRWWWLTSELDVLVELPVTEATHDFLWEPGRAPLIVMSGDVLAPSVEQSFALVRLPEALFTAESGGEE